jgi:2,4-dienoyl-CoA reductase-like NADH-dependent reductase (Old Yellow Enzyme family)/NADPH-dependent 2,4-dienoyl-CoA reductase/sulfur reductase-like enzyme
MSGVAASRYPHLLAPGRIGALELRNRMVMAPMGEDLGDLDGMLSDAQAAYLEARARGGLAMVMLGSVGVSFPVGCSNARQTAISDDRHIAGWAAAARRVHRHGAALAMQLTQAGANSLQDTLAGRPMWVASEPGPPGRDDLYGMMTADEGARMMEPFTGPDSKLFFKVLDHDDIASVIDDFASAVVRAREAGVDGCELHAGHGYLIDGFLSPAKNHRTDMYGGSLENRARLLVEILREIRARVGDDFAVWCRLNSTENRPDGTSLDECIEVARLTVAAGADAVHVSAYHDPGSATGPTDSYAPHVPGLLIENARAVKRAIDVPVIAVGRITPDAADAAIGDGACDFVSMGRMILAEPELPNLLAAGRPEEIRPCVYHYRCIGNIFVRGQVRCAANGSVGREDELVIGRTSSPRSVLVIGGGPSGMEAARVAALRGHAVTLVDAGARLGGRWAYAAATSDVNADLLRWLELQLELRAVQVRLGERLDADAVVATGADAVVVATGARWGRPELTGADLPHVRGVDDLGRWLLDGEPLGARDVVVLGGDLPGLGLAERAAHEGARVTVLEPSDVFALHLGLPGRWRRVHDLRAGGITLAGGTDVAEITPGSVRWRDLDGDHETPADIVFTTLAPAADTGLADDLRARGVEVNVAGDAGVGTGLLEHAMRTALETAVAL